MDNLIIFILFAIIITGFCIVIGIIFRRVGYDDGVIKGYKLGHGLREKQEVFKEKESEPNYKCKVCGFKFNIERKDVYRVRDKVKSGIVAAFDSSEVGIYEAIDCPLCTCQNILSERKTEIEVREITTNFLEGEEE